MPGLLSLTTTPTAGVLVFLFEHWQPRSPAATAVGESLTAELGTEPEPAPPAVRSGGGR
jgi:hypothetical protein